MSSQQQIEIKTELDEMQKVCVEAAKTVRSEAVEQFQQLTKKELAKKLESSGGNTAVSRLTKSELVDRLATKAVNLHMEWFPDRKRMVSLRAQLQLLQWAEALIDDAETQSKLHRESTADQVSRIAVLDDHTLNGVAESAAMAECAEAFLDQVEHGKVKEALDSACLLALQDYDGWRCTDPVGQALSTAAGNGRVKFAKRAMRRSQLI